MKIISGSRTRFGKKGMSPINKPISTRNTGCGSLNLSISGDRLSRTAKRNITAVKFSIKFP
jgi:hypothetical protein